MTYEISARIRGLVTTRLAAEPGNRLHSIREWQTLFRARLRDRRFWFVQAMIVAVTVLYGVFEAGEPRALERLYFIPASLYLFPVLYASLNFGLEGAVPTALWSAALAAPLALSNSGLELAGESFQVGSMLLLATLVAVRVDKEAAARRASDESERERRLSETKYRHLFEGASEAVLIVGESGIVEEGNAAAAALMGRSIADLRSAEFGALLGLAVPSIGAEFPSHPHDLPDVRIHRPNGQQVWLQPVLSPVPSTTLPRLTQVLLRDVTERHGLQRYAREIVRAQEDERQRIAQELHDVSVQSAILICRRLDAAMEAVDREAPFDVEAALAEARHTAEAMADELRRFSRDLRPLILDDLGLVPALKRLVLELRERSKTRVSFDVAGSVRRLDPSIELALFRIAQEALRNVESHSSADRASLRIAFGQAGARLTVEDNGSGFVVPALTDLVGAGRLGLLGMQERGRLVGGECVVTSRPGRGTTVLAEVPAVLTGEAEPLPLRED